VYPDSASFYCFACGLARDAVALLRAKEGLSLKGAIHKLEVTYGLPALPWEDDRPVAEVTRDTVQARLDPSRTFQDELKTFYSTLGWVTQERVLQMDQTLAFWEAGDQVSYKVGEGLMPEETGYKVLKVLQERLDQALRGCE
jgi:DNA primase